MTWGKLQRECHRLLYDTFDTKGEGYKWLVDNFGVQHFRHLRRNKDMNKLREIYDTLFLLQFKKEREEGKYRESFM